MDVSNQIKELYITFTTLTYMTRTSQIKLVGR